MDTETKFAQRPLTPDQVGAWTDLFTAILVADGDDDIMGEEDLAEEFTDPLNDFARGSIAVYDGATMIGYCTLYPRGTADPVHDMRMSGGVRGDYRNLGIGSQLLAWAEQAAAALHEERFGGQPLTLGGHCLARNTSAGTLFADHGYLPSRWFHKMTRDLSADISPSDAPDGVEIFAFADEHAADALLIRNESFRDHWSPADVTEESWAFQMASRAMRPEYSFIGYLDGAPVGLILAHEYEAYNEAMGVRDVYIPQIGTRKAARKRGIASALVTRTLTAAKADGFNTATLGVDADSPTGALGLYERLGFTITDTTVAYRKALRE